MRSVHRTYAVVIEATPSGCSAYVPDLPGCIVAGSTYDETMALAREAVAFHIEGLLLEKQPNPEPTTRVSVVQVAGAA